MPNKSQKTIRPVNGAIERYSLPTDVLNRLADDSNAANAAKGTLNDATFAKLQPFPEEAAKLKAQLDMAAEIAKLRAENEALKNRPQGGLTLKISEKGAVSVYGMGRFPITLYVEQWERLLGMTEQIKSFLKVNDAKLKRKGDE